MKKPASKVAATELVQSEALGAPVSPEAVLLVGSSFAATAVVSAYGAERVGLTNIMGAIEDIAKSICDGDMRQVEEMLTKQAIALQMMFAELATRAKKEKTLQGIQCLTQLALKTQGNCRVTLEALAEMKSPRQVAFVRQANVAHTQQVNNHGGCIPREKKAVKTPSKLLVEDEDGGTTVVTGATRTTGCLGSTVEAVAALDGAPDNRG